MRWRILNLKDMTAAPEALDILRPAADVDSLPADPDVLLGAIADYDGLITNLKVPVTREVMTRGRRLKVVASPSTGLDHIDLAAAGELGIHIVCLKYEREFLNSITATAEMAWALLLAVVRKIPWGFEAARQGHWARDKFRGRQLSGKTLGILGYGRLGTILAEYGKAFRMRVLAHDRAAVQPAAGVTLVNLDTLLCESDVLSIHIHLEEANRGLIGTPEFAKMKPGAVLVNTSRGAIVDEAAMLAALEAGHLAGAGLDVIDGEWRTDLFDHPVLSYSREHDNVVISPHVGGATWESQQATVAHTMTLLLRYIESGPADRGPVNRDPA